MKRNLRGYTLIEAIIVIAISSTIFLGVATIFGGSRQNVDFNQAKVDLESKLKGYVNQVSTGTFQGNSTHTCDRSAAGRPILTAAAGVTAGSNERCVYLGKALQPLEGTNKIYVYDVLGLRNKYSSAGVDTGQAASTYADTMAEPAGCRSAPPVASCPPEPSGGNFKYLFVEDYTLPSGMKVVYSRVNGNRANILKIYSNVTSANSSSKGITIYSNDYSASSGDEKSNLLKQCIEEDAGICSTRYDLESVGWDLCVENSDATKRTKLNVKPTSTGIVTTMSDGEC